MAVREDGEFELILGNKQLLSVLFIVIVLLGVFFVMGFLAGRSTGSALLAGKKPASQAPLPAAIARQAPASNASDAPPATAPEPAKAAPAQPESAPRDAAKPASAKPEPAKPETPHAAPAKVAPPRSGYSGGYVENPPSGKYLQAAATRRVDAETMLDFISSKTGLRGHVTPAPKVPELCRVLIGPLPTTEAIAHARAKLGDIGIRSAIIVTYK